jgi:hypothetical protein
LRAWLAGGNEFEALMHGRLTAENRSATVTARFAGGIGVLVRADPREIPALFHGQATLET